VSELIDHVKTAIAAGLAMLVAGCATLDRTMDAEDVAGIQRLGVTSALSNMRQHDFVGTLIFENKRQKVDVSDWDVPGFAEATLVKYLDAGPMPGRVGIIDADGLDKDRFAGSPSALLAAAKEQGFDAVAVIHPSGYDNYPYVTPGYGVYRKVAFGLGQNCAYQQTVVRILDADTGDRLAWEWGFNSWDGPCMPLPVEFKENPAGYTDVEQDQIQKSIEAVFDEGLERTVRKLKFGGASAF
jgi:hypothetical protein